MTYPIDRPPVAAKPEDWIFLQWFNDVATWIQSENNAVTVTTAYSAKFSDKLILINGNITVTLPDPTKCKGKEIICKVINAGGGTRTVSGTIDGGSSWTSTTQYETARFKSNGTQWWIV